ncbi:MAG TPA: PsiF family protein [Xanthobacteraceae bacterium]|jgi:hypothetical protein|nr:PsiF family protein [Xanthobacteraceae bacterium]
MNRILAAACAVAFLSLTATAPTFAQDKPEKKVTAQQQKMKDCAVKWKDEKAKTGVKGREAYRKFLSTCLKS